MKVNTIEKILVGNLLKKVAGYQITVSVLLNDQGLTIFEI